MRQSEIDKTYWLRWIEKELVPIPIPRDKVEKQVAQKGCGIGT
jgi:hypothetical protein